jgi:pimeloyl-ACP methyl ester carboxylesterase
MTQHVLLLHGLWNPRMAVWPLARRLRARGFQVQVLGYSTVRRPTDALVTDLAMRAAVLRHDSEAVHWVGHSLGGLLALLACNHYALPPGRIVCLGSPLQGSAAARGLDRNGLGWLQGQRALLLKTGCHVLPTDRQVGMLAGNRPVGLGHWFGQFDDAHDGTVSVSETRMVGLSDHLVLPTSHSGLLFSPKAAELTANFLETGYFRP